MLIFISWVLLGVSLFLIPCLIFRTIRIIYLKKKGLDKDFVYEKDDIPVVKGDFKDYVKTVKNIVVLIAITLIISIPSGYMFIKIETNKQDYIEEVQYADLYSLKDNLTTTGKSLMLGNGYIDGKMYYFYITKYKDGLIQEKLYAEDCYIIEKDNEKPRILKTKIKDNKRIRVDFFHSASSILPEKQYKIIIPKNSIVRNFKIDNE